MAENPQTYERVNDAKTVAANRRDGVLGRRTISLEYVASRAEKFDGRST